MVVSTAIDKRKRARVESDGLNVTKLCLAYPVGRGKIQTGIGRWDHPHSWVESNGLGCVIVVASQGHLKEHGGHGVRMKESMMEGKRFTVN